MTPLEVWNDPLVTFHEFYEISLFWQWNMSKELKYRHVPFNRAFITWYLFVGRKKDIYSNITSVKKFGDCANITNPDWTRWELRLAYRHMWCEEWGERRPFAMKGFSRRYGYVVVCVCRKQKLRLKHNVGTWNSASVCKNRRKKLCVCCCKCTVREQCVLFSKYPF